MSNCQHASVESLLQAVEEHELKSQRLHAKERSVNPQKHILEDKYAIRFPRRSPSTARACSSSSFPGSSLLSAEEESDFRMVVLRHSPSTASSSFNFSGTPFLSAEEESDFRMAVRLQAELNNQTLCGGSRADCVTFREGNEESNYCGMFVPARAGKHLRLSLNHQLREKKKW